MNYSYNIRGWLKGINDTDDLTKDSDPADLFAFKVNYDTQEQDLDGVNEPDGSDIHTADSADL